MIFVLANKKFSNLRAKISLHFFIADKTLYIRLIQFTKRGESEENFIRVDETSSQQFK